MLIFTFHHNKLWAWESIGRILLDSGFYISTTPIVRSEGKSGFHSSKGNIKYDCIFVCRKRPSTWNDNKWSSLKNIILKHAVQLTKQTLKSGMVITEVDVLTILMGKTIEYFTKAFPKIKHHNEPLTLAEALCEMENFASYVTKNAGSEHQVLQKSYVKKAEQLSMFIRESKENYKIKTH